MIGLSFPHDEEDGNEGDLHNQGSTWADLWQMVHHEGGKEGCLYVHGVHEHEEKKIILIYCLQHVVLHNSHSFEGTSFFSTCNSLQIEQRPEP